MEGTNGVDYLKCYKKYDSIYDLNMTFGIVS